MNKKRRLILLDSHAIIHRAYHALPEFVNSKGEPTGAIYGLATMLFKIINDLSPDYIVACFDLPKKTFRHVAYEGYKAKRVKADESLVSQLIRSRDFFKTLGIPIYECEGFEADDLLGTITKQLEDRKKDLEIIIASGDMDTLQLVSGEDVLVYTLKKGINDTVLYNEEAVISRFSFEPKYLPDYKGLRGDPSDNIIGIKGIGEKTAVTLISKYKTIENIYKNLDEDKNSLKEIGLTDRILKLLEEGKDEAFFSKTLATIRLDAPIIFELPKSKWKDSVEVNSVLEMFRDLEFRSLSTRFNNLFSGEKKEDLVFLENKDENIENIKDEDLEKAKIAFWLLNSEITNPEVKDIINYRNQKNFIDSYRLLEEDIKKEELDYVYRNIELPIIPLVSEMHKNGVLVDKNKLLGISKEYHKDLSLLEKNIWAMAGVEFNINSPKQIGDILFNKLQLSIKGIKKSAGGAISTRESELEKLRDIHPVINLILEYRELQKLLSTYIDVIPSLIQEDGRLHANFIQTGTTTGRFASNNPNIQNIPIKTDKGRAIRDAFIAPYSYVLASFDYSQIELRVTALMSQDEYFIKAFREGKDIHSAVAMKVFGVKEKEVTPQMRRKAKVINFGILYGMGVNALRQNLGTDRKEAQIFYENYFDQFPTIAGYLESIKNFAKEHGYTKTLFGRKRYFPGIKSKIPFIRAMAERMATNAPIQGTATADIIKIGMKKAFDAVSLAGFEDDVKLILQIHDELIFEIREDKVNKIMPIIKEAMEDVIPYEFIKDFESVPLVISSCFGKNWGDLK